MQNDALNDDDARTLQQLIDRHAVDQLRAIWCRALDRRDDTLLGTVFHHDSDAPRTFLPPGKGTTFHFTGSPVVELDGHTATSRFTVLARRRTIRQGRVVDVVVCGSVTDRVERRNGRWAVAARLVEHDRVREEVVETEWPPGFGEMPGTLVRGTVGPDDPLYRAPVHAGRLAAGGSRGALQELVDRAAVHDVMMRYCRAADRLDAELLATVYHPDARDDHGFFAPTGAQMIEQVRALRDGELPDAYLGTWHFVGTESIDVRGDWASAETGYLLLSRLPRPDGRIGDSLVGGRYLDEYERREGHWRLIDRVLVWDWLSYRPTDATREQGGLEAKRSLDDPVFAHSAGRDRDGAGGEFDADADPSRALRWLQDRAEIADLIVRATEVGGVVANTLITIDGDEAWAESYTEDCGSTAGPRRPATGRRHLDTLERRSGRWHLVERSSILDWADAAD